MILRLAAVGTFVLALIAAFFYATFQHTSVISIRDATASLTGKRDASLQVLFQVENLGGPDELLSAESDYASNASIVRPQAFATSLTAIPSNSTPVFSTDGVFIELTGLRSDLKAGDLVPLTLLFRKAGVIRFKAIISENSQAIMNHNDHAARVENSDRPTPQVSISVLPSSNELAWQVSVATEDFTFVNPPAGAPHVYGEGHAHVYLNGLKLQRLYGETASIGALPPGKYTVIVTLNSNTHSVYLAGERAVSAEVDITSE